MKKLIYAILFAMVFGIPLSTFAQAPQKFSYQAIVRDQLGNIYGSAYAVYRITIHDGSPTGPNVYQELQAKATNPFGLVTFEIGKGDSPSVPFCTIDWSTGDKFIEVEIDMGFGLTSMGTQQLLSVPYAMYANEAKLAVHGNTSGDMLYWNGSDWVVIPAGTHGQTLTLCDGVPHWGPCPAPPIVTTANPANITATTFESGGAVNDENGSPVIDRGVCWSLSPNPTLDDNVIHCGTGAGSFGTQLSGMAPFTTYYIRSFAVNGMGVSFGSETVCLTLKLIQ